MRHVRRASPAILALAIVLAWSQVAVAAIRTVTIQNFEFQPATSGARLGDTVQWNHQDGQTPHTSTSDTQNPDGSTGIAWWDSPVMVNGLSFSWIFTAAGAFPYHCDVHPSMDGTVRVPVKVARNGTVDTPFRVRWATEPPTEKDMAFIVQVKEPGGSFNDWVFSSTRLSGRYTPDQPGRYQFRARLVRAGNGVITATSLYSPVKSINVS